MGRWTLRHIDEVLVSRIESIVNGAIRQSREDSESKTKPPLSYESFVESLEEDDSFTVAIIEILLKELADRRTRPNVEDRRLISQQTSESLHSLAVFSGMYNPAPYNRFANRSTANLNGAPGPLYTPADSDEDDLGVGDRMGGIEGARIDSSLYDVYSGGGQPPNPRGYPHAPPLSATGHMDDSGTVYRPYEGTPIPGRQLPVPHSHFIPASSRRWTSVFGSGSGAPGSVNNSSPANATSLVRRHSIYRPVRRLVRMPEGLQQTTAASEFSEFAARRRSSRRQLLQNRETDGQSGPRGSAARLAEIQPPTSTFNDLPRAAIFDPPSPSGRDNGTRVPSPSPSTEGDDAQGGRTPRASRAYGLLHDPRENEDYSALGLDWQAEQGIQRVFRRPVRRARTILPPADSILPADSGSLGRNLGMSSFLRPEGEVDDDFERDFGRWFADDRVPLDQQQETLPSSVAPQETPASLPTPRSVSPTEENVQGGATLNDSAH